MEYLNVRRPSIMVRVRVRVSSVEYLNVRRPRNDPPRNVEIGKETPHLVNADGVEMLQCLLPCIELETRFLLL